MNKKDKFSQVDFAVDGSDETEPSVVSQKTNPSVEATDSKNFSLPVKKKRHYVLIISILALIAGGIFSWFARDQISSFFSKKPATTQTTSEAQTPSELDSSKTTDPELVKFITPTTGETWLQTPKDMAPQGWFKAELLSSYTDISVQGYSKTAAEQLKENMPVYKEVGSRNGATIVYVFSPGYGMAGVDLLFEKSATGKVTVLVNPQKSNLNTAEYTQELKTDILTPKITTYDQTTAYDSLNIPSKLAIEKGEYLLRPESYFGLSDVFNRSAGPAEGTTKTLISQLGASKLYKVEKSYADTKLTNIGYYIETPLLTTIGLRYEPNNLSLEKYGFTNSPTLQYKDYTGKMVYDELGAIARGCGGATAAVTRSDILKDDDLVVVGKTDTGRDVYELKNKSAQLYAKAYEEYKQTWAPNNVSFEEYVKQHGLVIIKNAKGEVLVYVRNQYAMGGGCAKPVVYLYPTTTRLVTVKVGAHVTVSEPLYPSEGWRNVVARPDGQLSYNGVSYESLFWEGQGFGEYPAIASGSVVKRAEAAAAMCRALTQQGLHTKEISDFMAFWESKIPNKPYIRLTWLTTEQINTLAPLSVTPKPDTIIRVFLDMDGYDSPPKLLPQSLKKIERKGFTVVEWGGLTSEIRH